MGALQVLLVSPGRPFTADGNFGNSHLVALGSYLKAHLDADVDLHDVDDEKHLPNPQPHRIRDTRYQLVGISCFSSFEYLQSLVVAQDIRDANPHACIVVGGYHPSARPEDFLGPHSPFDHVVVGEGERPLLRLAQGLVDGNRVTDKVLGPEMVDNLDALPLHDWSLLDRYAGIAKGIAGQFTLSLSRGCPFRCAFCMEGAKDSGWRAYSPERAELELRRLHERINLSNWHVYLTDPLFGIRKDWRREMLRRIQAMGLPVKKYWTLTRADLLDDDDIAAFHAANFGVGFGLESGDVEMLGVIHKTGNPSSYLERFRRLSRVASEIGFPWGANVIAGHPGETEASLRRSAQWLARLFAETRNPTGFFLVDPFRFYPGSPIDRDLAQYEARFGTRIYRKRWWNFSDASFNATWVDPSRTLDWATREGLTAELFKPIIDDVAARFAYQGPAPEYFTNSIRSQQGFLGPQHRLHYLRDHTVWQRLTEMANDDARAHPVVKRLLAERRRLTVEESAQAAPRRIRDVLKAVPREQFLPEEMLPAAAEDRAIPLTDDNSSTCSSLHAYAQQLTLLDVQPGDRVLELGSGTGYGAALIATVVGTRGQVTTYEAHSELAAQAQRNLAAFHNARACAGRADMPSAIAGHTKVLVCFALSFVDEEWLRALPEGGALLAPVGSAEGQRLVLFRRKNGVTLQTDHGPVRYVPERPAAPLRPDAPMFAQA